MSNFCREFPKADLVKDFDLTKFMGVWHTQFYLKTASFKEGSCPTVFF